MTGITLPPESDLGCGDDDAADVAALRRMNLVGDNETPQVTPLEGGVSSDIRRIVIGDRAFCTKRALARLKVAAHWEAPVSRNAAEVDWMRHVQGWLPTATPAILGEDQTSGMFAMAFLEPDTHPVWKAQLMAEQADAGFAAHVGRVLASIHAHSARDATLPMRFAYDDNFEALRLEPYLTATGRAHPSLAGALDRLAQRTRLTKAALMHGDVSPKNILIGPSGPVFLDAECACFGDPAFDLAFCLNHLLLKGARRGVARTGFDASFKALAHAYLAGVDWEPREGLEQRTASLLPALMLARIDGKSPVEYLTLDSEREAVRRIAIPLIEKSPFSLAAVAAAWTSS